MRRCRHGDRRRAQNRWCRDRSPSTSSVDRFTLSTPYPIDDDTRATVVADQARELELGRARLAWSVIPPRDTVPLPWAPAGEFG
jgi:hypothetical protein